MAIRRALIGPLILAVSLCATAQEAGTEIRIKAAFLYKFAEYVEWPGRAFATPASPIVIGVLGAETLANELSNVVADRQVAGRAVKVRRIAPGENVCEDCHVIFVGADRGATRRAQVLAQAATQPILTVTDDAASHPPGSVINFVAVDNRLRFDISREYAERNGLQLRSQLLRVARSVAPQ